MFITLKNLQQHTFIFDVDESKTVLEFKELIKDSVQCHPDKQKLIYAGTFMEDKRTLRSYNISENKFIVFMPMKSTPKPIKIPEPPTHLKPKIQENPKTIKESKSTKVNEAESILLVGDEYNEIVQTLMSMCVTTRELAEQALRASFNNPDRAVEYLINRQIPEVNYDQRELQSVSGISSPISRMETDEHEPLGFLRNQKEFHEMKLALHSDPNLLQSIIQSIGEQNPALLKLITENQADFVAMLNEPITSENQSGERIILAEEDRLAINRLKSLGYSEDAVLEAYFACDKNEELAANFLCGN